MKNKIGIMGGTFNPIHNGHIILADNAFHELNMDKILFMPSKTPPHKDNTYILSDSIRSDMIKLAINGYEYFEYSDFELIRNGITYTSDTLELLTKTNPNNEYFFIVGADSLLNIETWNRPSVLFKLAKFIVAVRDNDDYTILQSHINYLSSKYNAYVHLLKMNKIDISSSNIRKNIISGLDISDLVPYSVLKYIKEKKLYIL